MPIIADEDAAIYKSYTSYFDSLSDLDDWVAKPKVVPQLDGILPYNPRTINESKPGYQNKGRLLVCHDYKGGYVENPSGLSYTFNFWNHCDIFVYFSHHRVTIPPPGWINAAHRQGSKILGVLIFEHEESVEDCLRLLVGKLPKSRTAAVMPFTGTLPISSHYARLLADLAKERGFDGYLLNFEFALQGRSEQVRALEAWISILSLELRSKVGKHAEAIWYDSIIINGDLRWQDRLNGLNLPFFLASDSFFTNYTWPNTFPSLSASFLVELDASLMQGKGKSLHDIFVGIDVWGRGSHGGGGFGSYRAIEHIEPESMGLSVALFGPAWTWESEESKNGWSWEKWWQYERTLWIGRPQEGEKVDVPDYPRRRGEPPCTHGEFKPISSFFPDMDPPDPAILPFFTSFCPGAGYSWFVGGKRVLHKNNGWTDIDKQTSLGNCLWPKPNVNWEDIIIDENLPQTSVSLSFLDAFNGSSSVHIQLSGSGTSIKEGSFRCFWIPVQSLTVSSNTIYEAQIVYKASCDTGEIDLALSAKSVDSEKSITITPVAESITGCLSNGWSKATIHFQNIPSTSDSNVDYSAPIPIQLGLVIGSAFEDPSEIYNIDVQLGQATVFPARLPAHSPFESRLLWVDCSPICSSLATLCITWETCVSFTTPAKLGTVDPEAPLLPWQLDRSPLWAPKYMYFNVYMQRRDVNDGGSMPSEGLLFIGTSGTDGMDRQFIIDRSSLPEDLRCGPVRFYIQGLTDRGLVTPWEHCAYVDFDFS